MVREPRVYCSDVCRRHVQSLEYRLELYTVKTDGDSCWMWVGPRNDEGYGVLYHGNRTYLAHRLALERRLGRPLGAALALHACNNRICVRTDGDHLYEGDHAANGRDLAEANRGGSRKTSWDQRLEIAERAQRGEDPIAIAIAFGVTPATVRRWERHFFP